MILHYRIIKHLLWISGLVISFMLGYFAVRNYLFAVPVAEGNLRGMALALSSSIESLARKDSSLDILHELRSSDIAFFSVINSTGIQIFHSNHELEGSIAEDFDFNPDSYTNGYSEARLVLGTGEDAFEFAYPLHFPDRTLMLRLVLHAYRADAIVKRAQMGMMAIFSLMAAAWIMGIFIYRLAINAENHRKEMDKQENLARLGTMGAVLAHEVRNPLAGIKGYAQLLGEGLADENKKEYATLIVTETLRLENLVNDLLAYAKKERPESLPVKAANIINQALNIAEGSLTKKIRIKTDLEPDVAVMGDEDRLLQILLNLIRNAIQAMPDGGLINISAKKAGRFVSIEISDTGKGINPNDIVQIFEPFYTTKARGSGFGLAISRKYAEEMGGWLTASDTPGKGATFRLIIPSAGRKD